MRKFCLVALCWLLSGISAVAQDPKAEVFAGYSYLHLDCGSNCTVSSFPAGFNFDGTYYFARLLGVTADFDYHKKTVSAGFEGSPVSADVRTYGLHFGPRVKVRMGKIEPFGHALFGFTDANLSALGVSLSDKAFSMKLGGGLDVGATRHFAIRLGEFNYYMTKFPAAGTATFPSINGQDHQNNFTISAGIVIR